ncbi:toprim domain-containing protein [Bordetella bronchiseptica]|uniref:toprim domain-containing protein n=1 Tax=Bordetella bronchiseptica TaxID=518 RepID=UPI001F16E3E7|nr:toprim domain-containing protein [Bordetella bronchiseptica]
MESLAARLERLKREQALDQGLRRVQHLPGPPNFDVGTWPPAARVWLFKAGIGVPEIGELGAYWHESSGRLVIPLFDRDGNLLYWQARDVAWTRRSSRPKYVNPQVDKQCLVAKYGRGDPLVLTEDVLSAYRVGRSTEAWSLMGTSLTDCVAASILTTRPVRVWLDPDRPGRIAARTITKQLRELGIDAARVISRADPKILSNREIRNLLQR